MYRHPIFGFLQWIVSAGLAVLAASFMDDVWGVPARLLSATIGFFIVFSASTYLRYRTRLIAGLVCASFCWCLEGLIEMIAIFAMALASAAVLPHRADLEDTFWATRLARWVGGLVAIPGLLFAAVFLAEELHFAGGYDSAFPSLASPKSELSVSTFGWCYTTAVILLAHPLYNLAVGWTKRIGFRYRRPDAVPSTPTGD